MSAKRYKCPYCDFRAERPKLINHVDKKHEDLIPDGYTPSRVVYNSINKREHGSCMQCKKPTTWDEDKQRYNSFCSTKCKDDYVEMFQNRMINTHGTTTLLNDEEFQKKMLANRSISGKYTFSDGGTLSYVGSYEKKFLEFMDVYLNVKSVDLIAPGPVIEYVYNGETHKWITDFYYVPFNLVFDIKDGGTNPNNRNMIEYREKQEAKEKAIAKCNKYNYIRLTDNNFQQLILIMMELKANPNSDKPIIRINESSVLLESDIKIDSEYGFKSDNGTYNHVAVINGKNYRSRVEVLIIKDDDKIFLAKDGKGNYLIPGGSVDIDSTLIEQCVNECREEARIDICNVCYTGIDYIEDFGYKNTKTTDHKWIGNYNKLYIANYYKNYTGKIDEVDKDHVMIKGKFYPIKDVLHDLKLEWKQALGNYANNIILQDITELNNRLNRYEYMIVTKDGKRIRKIKEEDYVKKYYSLTPERFEKFKGGICWDYVAYEAKWFQERGIKYKTYFLTYDRSSHTVLLYYMNNKCCWFESSWKQYRGINVYDSESEALQDIRKLMYDGLKEQNMHPNEFFMIEYNALDPRLYNLSCQEYELYMHRLRGRNLIEGMVFTEGKIFNRVREIIKQKNANKKQKGQSKEKKPKRTYADKLREKYEYKKVMVNSKAELDRFYKNNDLIMECIYNDYDPLEKCFNTDGLFSDPVFDKMKILVDKFHIKPPITVYIIPTKFFNKVYDLYGDNAYEEKGYAHAVIPLSICDHLNDIKLMQLKAKLNARFFNDVVDNNEYREYVAGRHKRSEQIEWLIQYQDNLNGGLQNAEHDIPEARIEQSSYYPTIIEESKSNFEYIDIHDSRAKSYLENNKYYRDNFKNIMSMVNGEIVINKDDDKLAGYIYVGGGDKRKNRDYGFIQTLEIIKKYRGNGLSHKLVDDAIRKYNAVDLLVRKDNKIAIDLYKKHGFVAVEFNDKQNKDYYWMKLKSKLSKDDKILNESTVLESYVLSKNNMYINFDKFENGESNIVLITGLSGSGKSTLGESIASQYKAEYIELDLFEHSHIFTNDEQLKEAGMVFYDYLNTHKKLKEKLKKRQLKGKELNIEVEKFIKYCISYCKKDSNNKYVLEGVQIYSYLNKQKLNSTPIILVNTSMLTSIFRRLKREYAHDKNSFRNELAKLPQCIRWYIGEEKAFNKFKEEINESVILESTNNTLYHLSRTNLDGKIINPSIPSNFMTNNGYEENKTKRVCFSTSIDGCLRGMSQNLTGVKLYVHVPDNEESLETYTPTIDEVPDVKVTKEVWVKEPVRLKCIKVIEVIDSKGDGIPYTYGNGKTAELYDWDYKTIGG